MSVCGSQKLSWLPPPGEQGMHVCVRVEVGSVLGSPRGGAEDACVCMSKTFSVVPPPGQGRGRMRVCGYVGVRWDALGTPVDEEVTRAECSTMG